MNGNFDVIPIWLICIMITKNRSSISFYSIFKKISHLTFSDKKIILRLADEEFNTTGLAILDTPRKSDYMTHYDRFYLSTRLKCIDITMDKMKRVERLRQIQKRKSNIKLVWTNKKK